MTILEKIIIHKKKEVADKRGRISIKELEQSGFFNRNILSLCESILCPDKTGIIAEFKRRSPSKGIINPEASVYEITTGYSREGASSVSVLTDIEFFGGTADDLTITKESVPVPVLRKDFIIDEYQIIESKAIGADAVLLIASVLDKKRISNLCRLARSLGLEVILEVHSVKELNLADDNINIIGVNNRDLKTFKVDPEFSLDIAEKLPDGFVKISESGISSPDQIKKLKIAGYQGFLIGEKFMNSTDPVSAFSDFVKSLI